MTDRLPGDPVTVTTGPDDGSDESGSSAKLKKKVYERELARLQLELVRMQDWVKAKRLRVVVLFEGRDAAGKGGEPSSGSWPGSIRGSAGWWPSPPPTNASRVSGISNGTWHNSRRPARSSCFDRSWYNRAGVERVMGFASPDEVAEFMRACPDFERMLIRSGTILVRSTGSRSAMPSRSVGSRRASTTPQRAGSSARWTSRHGRVGSSSRKQRTRCSGIRTPMRRPGGWSNRMTNGAPT